MTGWKKIVGQKKASVPKARKKPENEIWTDEQEAIHEHLQRAWDEDQIDQARAGTGKTKTGVGGVARIWPECRSKKMSVAFAAFTKPVATELQTKVPHGTTASTLHALMLQVLKEAIPGTRVELNKLSNRVQQLFADERWQRGERASLYRLVGLAKNEGFREFDEDQLADLAERYDVNTHGGTTFLERTRKVLQAESMTDPVTEGVEFDDMIWLPYLWEIRPKHRWDLLVVDEVQDTNRVQHHNIRSIARRVMGIGDRRQSLFAFRGADAHAMDTLRSMLQGEKRTVREFPLTICWRCPETVIQLAQTIVPDIRARPGAPLGDVDVVPQLSPESLQPGDMVVCRTNSPLVRLFFQLCRSKVRAYIQGRKIGDGLIDLVKSESQGCEGARGLERLMSNLQSDMFHKEAKLLQRPDTGLQLALLRDRYDCLFEMVTNAKTLEELLHTLKYMFQDGTDKDRVRLSSIHKAKGLEADNVFIIEPHLLPHPMAKQEWEQEGELNCGYVAATRARNRLVFVGQIPNMFERG